MKLPDRPFNVLLLAAVTLAVQSGGAAPGGQKSGTIATSEMIEALGTDDASLKAWIIYQADYAAIDLQGRAGAIRLMPSAFQESLLRALYVFTRAYVESDAFPGDYLSYRKRMEVTASKDEDPKDPRSGRELVRSRLRFYLEQTANVDFSAALELRDGKAYFTRETYELSTPVWKACFRMGPGICKLSRLLAEDWLKDLDAHR